MLPWDLSFVLLLNLGFDAVLRCTVRHASSRYSPFLALCNECVNQSCWHSASAYVPASSPGLGPPFLQALVGI